MKNVILGTAATMLVFAAANVSASIIYDNNQTYNVSALTTESTSGADMLDIAVTITSSGGKNTYYWGELSAGVFGVNFDSDGDGKNDGSLTMSGSSWTTAWDLEVTTVGFDISNILIDALAGNTVFDTWYYDQGIGSANSYYGKAFDTTSGDDSDIVVTYSGAIGLDGAYPVGDLYAHMNIDFGDNTFGYGDKLSFKTDTDTLAAPVPEPATVLLFGLGLTGLLGYNRKRNSKRS